MGEQVNIGFDQLVKIVKMLPERRLKQLLAEIECERATKKSKYNLEVTFKRASCNQKAMLCGFL